MRSGLVCSRGLLLAFGLEVEGVSPCPDDAAHLEIPDTPSFLFCALQPQE